MALLRRLYAHYVTLHSCINSPKQYHPVIGSVKYGNIKVKNDGLNDIDYDFGDDKELNERISFILNETVHVFRYHLDGNWKEIYKPKYAAMLATEIEKRPSLIKKLVAINDPVVKNITYAAIEYNKEHR